MEYIDDIQCFLCSSSAPFFVGGRFCSLTSFFSAGALNWIHTIFRILLQSHLHRALHLFSSSVAMSVLCTRGSECVIMRIPLNWSSRILCYLYLFAEKCKSKNHIPIEIDSWNAWNTHTHGKKLKGIDIKQTSEKSSAFAMLRRSSSNNVGYEARK